LSHSHQKILELESILNQKEESISNLNHNLIHSSNINACKDEDISKLTAQIRELQQKVEEFKDLVKTKEQQMQISEQQHESKYLNMQFEFQKMLRDKEQVEDERKKLSQRLRDSEDVLEKKSELIIELNEQLDNYNQN